MKVTAQDAQSGSSPRMRGALTIDAVLVDNQRIIPADAGSTISSYPVWSSLGDHPRGCGEHMYPNVLSWRNSESSPRMRGARAEHDLVQARLGIIPADAGSTRPLTALAAWSADHPRGCGEHKSRVALRSSPEGSSPRMRGALYCTLITTAIRRIIPADAGSTRQGAPGASLEGDHPRGCGEHVIQSVAAMLTAGSSPRMRGAPHKQAPIAVGKGIIPADAGSTP